MRVRTSTHGETRRLTQPKSQNQITNVDHEQVRRDPSFSEIPELLQKFRDNLVDERVPEHRVSHASSSHEPSSESLRRVVPGNQCLYSLPERPKLRDLRQD